MIWSRKLSTLFSNGLQPSAMNSHISFWKAMQPVDVATDNGSPEINRSFSILEFFNEKLNKSQSMFEYGSGNSTLYFAKRIKNITSICPDEELHQKLLKDTLHLDNITLRVYGLNRNYANAIVAEGPEKQYELISVNGLHRAACAINAQAQLTSDGILMLNDSEGENNEQVFDYYNKKGFNYISFSSQNPYDNNKQAITLFYKAENCFNL